NTGFSGGLDPSGWQMTTGSDQELHFVRAGSALSAKKGSDVKLDSAQAPFVPGDENWDDRFYAPGVNGEVHAIAISGTNTYVGGSLATAGGVIANDLARWDGSQWFPLGSGASNGVNNGVFAIGTSGSNVYVGGRFGTAGGVSANHVARWD